MKPAFRIEIDGKELGEKESSMIESVEVVDEVGTKADSCTIVFSDRDRIIKKPKRGVSIRVFAGYEGQELKILGRYVADGFSIRRGKITVKGKGFDGKTSIKNSADAIYDAKSIAEVVSEVAKRNGLNAKVSPEFAKEKQQIIQQGESDLAFLNRIAKENDATFKVQNKEILFVPRGKGTSSNGEKLPEIKIDFQNIRPDWSYDDDPRDDFGEVSAKYFDQSNGDEGEVKQGTGEPKKTLQRTYGSKAEANAAIRSEHAKARESAERLTLTVTLGDASLKSERRTRVKDLDPDVDGVWIITKATHKIGKGWEVPLELKKVIRDEE